MNKNQIIKKEIGFSLAITQEKKARENIQAFIVCDIYKGYSGIVEYSMHGYQDNNGTVFKFAKNITVKGFNKTKVFNKLLKKVSAWNKKRFFIVDLQKNIKVNVVEPIYQTKKEQSPSAWTNRKNLSIRVGDKTYLRIEQNMSCGIQGVPRGKVNPITGQYFKTEATAWNNHKITTKILHSNITVNSMKKSFDSKEYIK